MPQVRINPEAFAPMPEMSTAEVLDMLAQSRPTSSPRLDDIFGAPSPVDDYFQRRQDRRAESNRQAFERTQLRRIDEADRLRLQDNTGRKEEDRNDMTCGYCLRGMNTRKDKVYRTTTGHVCGICYEHNYMDCISCGNAEPTAYAEKDTLGRCFCPKCATSQKRCAKCNMIQAGNTCENCIEEKIINDNEPVMPTIENYRPNSNGVERKMYSTRKLKSCISEELGEIVKSPRIFSAELEFIYPDNVALNKAVYLMPKSIGIEGDGSVHDENGEGIEIQTPRLSGKAGEEYIKRVSLALRNSDMRTNKTCGLHIHLSGGKDFVCERGGDIRNKNGQNVKNLMLFYMVFEDVIHSFLPVSRRTNEYCPAMRKKYRQTDIELCTGLEQIESIWYNESSKSYIRRCKGDHKHSSRYCGINMHTLLSGNHLEIRYHSGTLQANRILEWANLHALIMDNVANQKITREAIRRGEQLINLEEKTELFLELAGLSDRSKSYFLQRQSKFAKKKDTTDEENLSINEN